VRIGEISRVLFSIEKPAGTCDTDCITILLFSQKKEKQTWAIVEKEIKAKEKTRKRPSLLQRKNEN
jgi:hypothetical protein